MLQKRRWLVLGSLTAVVLLVTLVSLFLPKRYEASSRLLLDLEGPGDLGLEQIVMPMGLDMNTKLETQIRIVQSDTIATSVIKQLGLHHNKGFAGELFDSGEDFDTLGLQKRAKLVNRFQDIPLALTAKVRPYSLCPICLASIARPKLESSFL